MRWWLAFLVAWSSTGAAAPRRPKGKDHRDFWGWLIEPNRAEVDLILDLAMKNKQRAGQENPFDVAYGVYDPRRAAIRAGLLGDAEGMLRYALRLSPDNRDVLRELAVVMDENDRPGAGEALERYVAREAPDAVTADARVRLGRWYARQRRWSDAVAQLRLALGTAGSEVRARTLGTLLLAEVYMQSGHLADAIDLLRPAAAAPALSYPADTLTPFALAVAYDRDEQVTLAHDTIERLTSDALGWALIDQLGTRTPFVPPSERHYFAALQFEVMGNLIEALTEWQAYARTDGAPYRARARQHIADVERLLRERAAAAAARERGHRRGRAAAAAAAAAGASGDPILTPIDGAPAQGAGGPP